MAALSIDKAREALLFLIALVLSISVHEYGHAWMATRLGDPLPRQQGRLTLSPMAHIDPIGTLLMPLLMFFTGIPLLGWGRPVHTNPAAYTRRFHWRTGHMLVAAMGPAMNLAMAVVVSLAILVLGRSGVLSQPIAAAVALHMVQLNIFLAFFNLIPVPPLDGGNVLAGLLPESMQHIPLVLQRFGFLILLVLVMTPLLGILLAPVGFLWRVWAGVLFGIAYP